MSDSSDNLSENQSAGGPAPAERDDWRPPPEEAGGQSAAWQPPPEEAGGQSAAWQPPPEEAGGQQSQWRDNSPPRLFAAVTDHPGLSLFFRVTLEIVNLGFWTKVSGLGMSIATDDRGDSAMSFFQHHLPGHMTYEKVTLERPVSSDTATVMNWISAYHMLPVPTTAEIACVDQSGATLMSWEMFGVTPVSWRGPSFDANATNVATEILTLAHMGFM
jgi:phage tail-like protein